MKNTITEMKNTLQGISRLGDTQKYINNLEGTIMEITPPEQKKKNKFLKMRIV